MGKTLAETIKEIIRKHLEENNGMLLGQCINAVGWVNNTVPNCKNIVELPMTDVGGSAIACGVARSGRRPIFVLRFQDFIFLNSNSLVNYAAKTKYLFGYGTPIFIRALAVEGHGTGPTHSSILHSIFMHMPGIKVACPMTPKEYKEVWNEFMKDDVPIYVSEHRWAFNQREEMKDVIKKGAVITLYGVSASRLRILEASKRLEKEGIICNIVHINWLKPIKFDEKMLKPLSKTKIGLVVDSDYEICGASQSIAYELMKRTNNKVYALGGKDGVTGTYERHEKGTPKTRNIIIKIKEILNGNKKV